MIIKELDPFSSDNKYEKSGRAAEESMAFYLRRFYQDDPTVHILNSIRVEENNDAAQIDHLIIHTSGMIVIECKSVRGTLQLKPNGQWIRWYGKQSKGMGSPIKQAELQIDFLRKYLNKRNAKDQNIFDKVPIEILVAISNDGQFLPPKNNPDIAPEICKMDQVKERIDTIRKSYMGQILSDQNISALSEFLIKSHKPLIKQNAITIEEEEATYEAITNNKCKHCESINLEMAYGKSYYFRCLDCNKNTSISIHCDICNRTEKIRKDKDNFFIECSHCNTSKLFHSNI